MRNKRFIAAHRGGPLQIEQHRQLIRWACICVAHVLPLLAEKPDQRLGNALLIAQAWADGNSSVGDARKASTGAIAVANQSSDPIAIAVARAAGHAVATAHMADHSLRAALYALKAIRDSGESVDSERKWQNEHLPPEIRELVINAGTVKEKALRLG